MLNAVFHADLSDAHPGEDYWLSVAGRRIPMVPHTPATLNAALSAAPHLTAGRTAARLTHFSATPGGSACGRGDSRSPAALDEDLPRRQERDRDL
jgi:hypothetical protein